MQNMGGATSPKARRSGHHHIWAKIVGVLLPAAMFFVVFTGTARADGVLSDPTTETTTLKSSQTADREERKGIEAVTEPVSNPEPVAAVTRPAITETGAAAELESIVAEPVETAETAGTGAEMDAMANPVDRRLGQPSPASRVERTPEGISSGHDLEDATTGVTEEGAHQLVGSSQATLEEPTSRVIGSALGVIEKPVDEVVPTSSSALTEPVEELAGSATGAPESSIDEAIGSSSAALEQPASQLVGSALGHVEKSADDLVGSALGHVEKSADDLVGSSLTALDETISATSELVADTAPPLHEGLQQVTGAEPHGIPEPISDRMEIIDGAIISNPDETLGGSSPVSPVDLSVISPTPHPRLEPARRTVSGSGLAQVTVTEPATANMGADGAPAASLRDHIALSTSDWARIVSLVRTTFSSSSGQTFGLPALLVLLGLMAPLLSRWLRLQSGPWRPKALATAIDLPG